MPNHLSSGFTHKVEEQQLWLSRSEGCAGACTFHPTAWGPARVVQRGLPCPTLSITRSLFWSQRRRGWQAGLPQGLHEAAERVPLLSRGSNSCSARAGRCWRRWSRLRPSLGTEPRALYAAGWEPRKATGLASVGSQTTVQLALCPLHKPNHQFSAGFKV